MDSPTFLGVLAVTGGLFAATAPAAPTGTPGWDFLLKFALAAVVVASVSISPQPVAILFATVGAVFSGSAGMFAVAATAQVLAIAPVAFRQRHRFLGATSGVLAAQVLFRLPPVWFFGFPTLIAGVPMVLALLCGYRCSSRRARTVAKWSATGLAVAGLVVGLVGGLSLAAAGGDVELGIGAARRGLLAAREADATTIVEELNEAERALLGAQSQIDSLPARLLGLIPIAAQQRRAVSVATGEGVAVARLAAATVRDADIASIRLTAGAVDVAALQAMAPQLDETATALEGAAVRIEAGLSPWLVSAVADRIDGLLQEIADVAPEARLAADGAAVLPRMLGSEGPRHYYVMFGTPAESRELGGLLGSWALLRFDNGVISKVDDGRTDGLRELARSGSLDVSQYPAWYFDSAHVLDWPQNLTATPDMSVAARATRELLGGVGGMRIDGVVYIDTWALVDLLELTGPVDVSFQLEPLTAENAPAFFFDGQYRLDSTRTETFDELSEALDGVLLGLTTVELPSPERLGSVLGPAARGGRLQVVTFDEAERAFLRDTALLRDFGRPQGRDAFAVVQTNADSDKLDLYVHRDITYDVAVDDAGSLAGTVTVLLDLDLPDDPPEYALGENSPGEGLELLSLYSPHAVTAVLLDGVPQKFASAQEYGYGRFLVAVATTAGRTRVVEFEIEGMVDPTTDYSLAIWHQPLVNDDQVHVRYSGPGGVSSATYTLVENVVFRPTGLSE